MSPAEHRHAPSLRRLLGALLGILGVGVAGLILVTTLQLRGSQKQSDAENRRTRSFVVADSMRKSSNDLTNMVRLYVATGDRRYREHYDEILAIRAGTAPRPRDYETAFWDKVLADGKAFVRYGPAESLVDQMRAADFAPEEFRALRASLAASDRLAAVELDVMDRVARRIARGVDDSYLADVRRDYRRLVDRDYLAQKGVIMREVERFIDLVETRTAREVDRLRDSNDLLSLVQIGILGLIVLVGVAALTVVSRLAVRPLGELGAATRRIAGGHYDGRVEIRAVAELEQVAGAFNEMADAVQADVAARQRAEQEAVEASKAKSSFVAAMSHEIRTPMIGVTGMLEILSRTELSPQQRRMVRTAETSAQSLLQIIGDVLDFSKIEASKLELAPTTIDLRRIVAAAVETFRHTASAKGLLLTSSVDERLAPAQVGDPMRLRQIITNFLSNAVKFTSMGGIEVDVRVLEESPGAQTVEVSVTDTGMGLSPEQRRELFSEYAQAEASTAQRFGGTGLGLSICRRLATLMGGAVTMDSELGTGTTLRLRLPLPVGDVSGLDPVDTAAAEHTAIARDKPTREQAEAEGSLLLVVEDHAVNRTVIAHQLEIIGFEADFAEDGEEALELYRQGRYGLVVTDIHMPRMDGFELARAIRRHEEQTGAARTPIVALTANVMQGEPERCREAGMDDFAAKPTAIPFLAAKLRQLLPHLEWTEEASPLAEAGAIVAGVDGAVDLTVLAEVTGGDAELAMSLVRDFLDSTRADLDALDQAFADARLDDVRRLAHRVKGAARIVGAHALAALAQQLETGAESATGTAELEPLAARLRGELAHCESAAAALN